jgi:secreted protein with Ig-like and vWFA domain
MAVISMSPRHGREATAQALEVKRAGERLGRAHMMLGGLVLTLSRNRRRQDDLKVLAATERAIGELEAATSHYRSQLTIKHVIERRDNGE